ncbi:hypothetical protein [Nocardia sp. NPDC059239]
MSRANLVYTPDPVEGREPGTEHQAVVMISRSDVADPTEKAAAATN